MKAGATLLADDRGAAGRRPPAWRISLMAKSPRRRNRWRNFPPRSADYTTNVDWPLDKETHRGARRHRLPESRLLLAGMNQADAVSTSATSGASEPGATIHSPKNCLPGAGWNP